MGERFSTTRWSVVLAAGGEGDGARAALTELCQIYWRPVFTFVRWRNGHDHDGALDLTQAFFTRLIEHHDIARLDPNRGRFRSWLLRSVKNFIENDRDYWRAHKRDRRKLVWLDTEQDDGWSKHGLIDHYDPERAYACSWAYALLQRSVGLLGAAYAERGKERFFAHTRHLLAVPSGEAGDYAAQAQALGVLPETLKVQVHRMREDFRAMVRAEVAELVETPQEVEPELRWLLSSLRAGA